MVAVRNSRGYPASYVTDFVKSHKKKMLRRAQELRVRNPESIAWKKWYEQKKKDVEEYQARKAEEDARKAAEEAARAEMQGLNDTIDSLCASESLRFWKVKLLCFTVNKVIAKILLIVCILYLQGLDAPAAGKQIWLVLGTRRIGQ
jgi:hypothetical protein